VRGLRRPRGDHKKKDRYPGGGDPNIKNGAKRRDVWVQKWGAATNQPGAKRCTEQRKRNEIRTPGGALLKEWRKKKIKKRGGGGNGLYKEMISNDEKTRST